MLDKDILAQVSQVFASLNTEIRFDLTGDPKDAKTKEMLEFITEVASCSPKIEVGMTELEGVSPRFAISRGGEPTGIVFRCIPGGHEFTSLLLAVLNSDGQGKNLPDSATSGRIGRLKGRIQLSVFVSLECTNCPDVVQACDVMALYNPNLEVEIIDGALNAGEAEALHVQAVPTVFANGSLLHVGRGSLGELLTLLEERFGSEPGDSGEIEIKADLIIIGGGPAGASAAIYSARKGLDVAIVAGSIGGQVRETTGIENLISAPVTTGMNLAGDLRKYLDDNKVRIYDQRSVEEVDFTGDEKSVKLKGGEVFKAPQVIIATGAGWRKLNVPGESDYIGRGVAFCAHCDGPFYAGKDVAVVGGGNSGIEAAIDLAGICRKVTVFEFLDTLKADTVLIEKAKSLPNIEIHTSMAVEAVEGNGTKLTGLLVKDRNTGESKIYPEDGVFVQIGLLPNSGIFAGQVAVTPRGEIEIDDCCRTGTSGIYAAGDVTTVPYKQIVIAIGEGAKAALSAFNDRIRK
ncbi:MAG: alkyl hydroperoxide reductase subunit F [Muribaculaceae bacterium]|nr:alkyl hydroperoxide reductase subunit F [Muribaculaceae bacterium]